MKKYKELENKMLVEVKTYLQKNEIDLLNRDAVFGALDEFCSDEIEKYMDDNNLELMFTVDFTENNELEIEVTDL